MDPFSLQVVWGDPLREEGRAGDACRRPHGLHDVPYLQEALHVRRVGAAPGKDRIHDTFTNGSSVERCRQTAP